MSINFDKSFFNKNGFIIIDPKISDDTLKEAQLSFMSVYKKAELGLYPYIRVYDDYIGKINISGIEMPFHPDILDNRIANFLNSSNLASIVKKFFNSDVKMTLSRYHVTRQYSHVGNWHRDGRPNENNVLQASIFLFNEQGLEIIPGSHTRENSKRERQCLNISDHSNLPNSLHLKAKKGSILIFHPAILHRGISINSRANIHFRFEVDHHYSYGEGFKNCHLFNKDWGSILDNKNTVLINSNIIKYARDESIAGYLKRVIKSIIHFLIFWLPLSSFVYRRFGSYPSLIVRKYFKVK